MKKELSPEMTMLALGGALALVVGFSYFALVKAGAPKPEPVPESIRKMELMMKNKEQMVAQKKAGVPTQ